MCCFPVLWTQPHGVKASQTSPAQPPMTPPATEKQNLQNTEPSQTSEPVGYVTVGMKVWLCLNPLLFLFLYSCFTNFFPAKTTKWNKINSYNTSTHIIQLTSQKNIDFLNFIKYTAYTEIRWLLSTQRTKTFRSFEYCNRP